MKNARNLPQEKLTERNMPSPYAILFCCLLLSFELWQKKSSTKNHRLGSYLLRLLKMFRLFPRSTQDAFFLTTTLLQVASVHKPNNNFYILVVANIDKYLVYSMYRFFSQLSLCSGRWEVFLLITGLNQRGDLKAPPFSFFFSQLFKKKRNGEKIAVKSVSFLKHWCSHLFPIFSLWDIIVNIAESFTYCAMFCFPL